MSDPRPAVLVVDDDAALRTQLGWLLGDEYDLHVASDKEAALAKLRQRAFPVVLLDLHLTEVGGDLSGLDVLRWIAQTVPESRVILMTGESDPRIARETLRWGAWDFYPKPIDPQELRAILGRACRLGKLVEAGRDAGPETEVFGSMLTRNPEMARVLRAARELAGTRLPVLIVGPSGCGKSRLATEIQKAGLPEGETFEQVPPAVLPDPASGPGAAGWILEQVDLLPPVHQRRLADLLEAGSGSFPRIVATAGRDLLALARRRRFHAPLARRMETARLEIPPLAARPEDLEGLVQEFLGEWAAKREAPLPRLAPAALESLRKSCLRMEVGDLRRVLHAAASRADGPWLGAELLLAERGTTADSLKAQRNRLEAGLISETLLRLEGNVSRAARELGVSRPTLHDLMRKHDLDPTRFRRR